MGKVYLYANTYLVSVGAYGQEEVSANSHAQARYLAWVQFVDAYGRYGYDCDMNRVEYTLLWFAKHSSVKMTVKSASNSKAVCPVV